MGAFKSYDIRGVYNVDFNKEDVYKIGFFLPELLKTDKVLIGRDVRESSPEIYEYLTRGITNAGADVYDLGLATTPFVYWATARYGFDASVQITASHNAREYNGMKISRADAIPVGYDSGLNLLEEMIHNRLVHVSGKKGNIISFDKQKEYLDFLRQYLPDTEGFNVGIDCSNGMASLFIKEILGERASYIFFEPDGTFPNHEANPLMPENIRDLQHYVRKNNCDVGAIFDGDADRVMFVDEMGNFVSPDLIIAVLAHYFSEKGMYGNVLEDIRSSKAVGEYIAKLGYQIFMWRVGRAHAAPRLREIDGLFGGEFAGHYYFRDFFYSDSGILACLMVLDVLANMKRKNISFSSLIKQICPYKSSGEINFRLENKQQAMEAVKDFFMQSEKPIAFYDFDGYRADFQGWWFNIRMSNTEPYLRFIAEAESESKLQDIVQSAREIIHGFS